VIDSAQFTLEFQSLQDYEDDLSNNRLTLGYVPDSVSSQTGYSTQFAWSDDNTGGWWALSAGTVEYGSTELNTDSSVTQAILSCESDFIEFP